MSEEIKEEIDKHMHTMYSELKEHINKLIKDLINKLF